MSICFAQSYDSKIVRSSLSLPSGEIKGFSTFFDFDEKKVERGWWKYAKKFAIPKNMRTHYQITIPATEDSRFVIIFTQKEARDLGTTFKLGLDTSPLSDKEKYQDQAKSILLDYKRWYYLRHFEEQLKALEKAISKKGRNWDEWLQFVRKKDEILEKMKKI